MEFKKLPESQQRVFAQVNNKIDEIRGRSATIVAALAQRCGEIHTFASAGFAILVDENGVSAAIKSPIGDGRIALQWAIHDDALVGVLRFEKLCRDEYDGNFYKLVWALFVPQNEAPYSSKEHVGLKFTSSPYDDDHKANHFEVLTSVFAAFADFDLAIK